MKQITIILTNHSTTIKVNKTHIEFITDYENRIVGIRQINALYINEKNKIELSKIYPLLKHFKIFFILDDGAIVKEIHE